MGNLSQEAALLGWLFAGGLSVFLAALWLMYLNKIVQNEEDLLEQIRAEKRLREEAARKQEAGS